MLIQFTRVSELDESTKTRLLQQVKNFGVPQSHSKYINFEGKLIQLSEVQKLLSPSTKKILLG